MAKLTRQEKIVAKSEEMVEKYYALNDLVEGGRGTNPYISRNMSKHASLLAAEFVLEELKSEEWEGSRRIDGVIGIWKDICEYISNKISEDIK